MLRRRRRCWPGCGRHDPDRYNRIGHILACKDWLRYCLTGTIGTDRTEASTSFTDVRSQDYAPDSDAHLRT